MDSDNQKPLAEETGSYKKPSRNSNILMREKLRAAALLSRLERNALGELDPPMDKDQIRSAEICLRKCIPDLANMTIEGNAENPVALSVSWLNPTDR